MPKASEYAKARFDRLKAEGCCPRCAVRIDKRKKHTFCQACREYVAEYARARRAGMAVKKIAKHGKGKTTAEYEAKRRKKQVKLGKCSICAKRKATSEMRTCMTCRRQAKIRYENSKDQ